MGIKYVTLGSTGITVPQNAFGALPIQRADKETAKRILLKAYEGGITFFDTARAYTDSEEKLGYAFHDIRDKIIIASKTGAKTVEGFWKDLHTSLEKLQTTYIDIYQFHNPKQCYKPGDGTGMYEAMLEAKEKGMIRHISITNHLLSIAEEAIDSGLYETLQFPFSYLAGEHELNLVEKCKKANMGFIAMKGLAGGLLSNSKACFAYMTQFDNVLPIWGVQKDSELYEWLSFFKEQPELDDELKALIEADRKELVGEFCRGCGYCMPCPKGIVINTCARMSLLLRRAPSANNLTPEAQKMMFQIEECIGCGQCMKKCPYGLNTPELLKKNLEDYKKILAGEVSVGYINK